MSRVATVLDKLRISIRIAVLKSIIEKWQDIIATQGSGGEIK